MTYNKNIKEKIMEITIVIILLALLQFIYFTGKAGFTRVKHGVDAPNTTGNVTWECIYRVQQNTMEQLVIFIPAMLTFQFYVSQKWVMIPGVIFIVGRAIFSHLYTKDPKTRGPGMILSFFSNIALVVGSLIGIAIKLIGL